MARGGADGSVTEAEPARRLPQAGGNDGTDVHVAGGLRSCDACNCVIARSADAARLRADHVFAPAARRKCLSRVVRRIQSCRIGGA